MPSQNTKLRQALLKRRVFWLVLACGRCFRRHRVLWFDLTLLPSAPQTQVASLMRPWNRLNAVFFSRSPHLMGWLRVVEARTKTGALHIHGLMITRVDAIRPAYPSELLRGQVNPWSLNSHGEDIADEMIRHATRCGFGRTCVQPIRKTFLAVAKYLRKSFKADIFSYHPYLLGAQRFRISAKLIRELRSRQMGIRVGSR